ncbi:hypothetical protein GBN33_00030 [Plesiomonas shigelloides]|uniref:YkgJ family cysteine cluster protein n=1 Tax=Plesiomonas shigelloides TaxID=703 RepID=UPI0012622ECC|nr:YkgJ family cysteine cluster protein [Plesiomonas shigelloides]KAB7703681.1 hypothetical protein GBN33_00030 [Plesiomonas shigelloides]
MDAFDAIPILESKISILESQEESWKNCRACPFNGKCCDGATLIAFPEEIELIKKQLKRDQDVLAYAISRYKKGKACYFYDKESSRCLIHDVRPLNCRWTPYVAFSGNGCEFNVNIRSSSCDFSIQTISCEKVEGNLISLPKGMSSSDVNTLYLHWQSIVELHPLMKRASEMIELKTLMMELAT